jgi:predicted RNA binding protein YcfA (HicA-like mRNA interferase family)
MPKFPVYTPRGIQKILLKNGFFLKRQTGSHRIFYNKNTEKMVIVSFHSKDIPIGTLKSIIQQSGLNESVFY